MSTWINLLHVAFPEKKRNCGGRGDSSRLKVLLWRLLLFEGLLLFLIVRRYLESSLIGHMLVQIPLLIAIGACAGLSISVTWRSRIETFNSGGIPGIVLATLSLAFWMMPKSLDAATVSPLMEFIKCLSVPLMVGMPLAISWTLLGFVGQSFVVLNAAAMFIAAGYLYLIAPIRLCNAYLINQQEPAGYILILYSGLLVVAWLVFVVAGAGQRATGRAETVGETGARTSDEILINS